MQKANSYRKLWWNTWIPADLSFCLPSGLERVHNRHSSYEIMNETSLLLAQQAVFFIRHSVSLFSWNSCMLMQVRTPEHRPRQMSVMCSSPEGTFCMCSIQTSAQTLCIHPLMTKITLSLVGHIHCRAIEKKAVDTKWKKWHLFKRIGSLTYTPKPGQNWKQELAVGYNHVSHLWMWEV